MNEREEETKAREEESEELSKTKVEVERELQVAKTLKNQILSENENINQTKSQLLDLKIIEQEQLEKLISEREKNKARINEFLSKKL